MDGGLNRPRQLDAYLGICTNRRFRVIAWDASHSGRNGRIAGGEPRYGLLEGLW